MKCNVLVVGSGMAGVCAAIQAGRDGLLVILVEKEMLLGGNWGVNLGIGAVGALHNNPYYNETGLVSEIEATLSKNNARIAEDVIGFNLNPKWDFVISEMLHKANVVVLRKQLFYDVEKSDGVIKKAYIKNIETLDDTIINIDGYVVDASGDANIAYKAGADYTIGREEKNKFGESYGVLNSDEIISAASITAFTVDMGHESEFIPPKGTLKWNASKPANSFNPEKKYNILFQVDEGGDQKSNHALFSPQDLYMNLVSKMYSIWDYFKNVLYKEEAKNHQLVWISPILGKRESRRVLGDYIVNQNDVESCRIFKDAIGFGGFLLDEHPPSNDGGYETRFFGKPLPYDIPLRSIYSRNIKNLFMAGRNISVSHVVFTSSRVIRTGGVIGQAAAISIKYCIDNRKYPCELNEYDYKKIQQNVLKNDGNILSVKLEDENNFVNKAKVTATSQSNINQLVLKDEYKKAENIGVCLYYIPEYIDDLFVYVKNNDNKEKKLTLRIGYGQTPPNTFNATDNDNDEYFFKYPDRQDHITNFNSLYNETILVKKNYNGWIKFKVNRTFQSKMKRNIVNEGLLISLKGEINIRLTKKHLDILDGMKNEGEWKISKDVFAFKFSNEIIPGNVKNINDGYIHREGLSKLHQWVSDLESTVPQSLFIDFNTKKEFNKVVIRFDETLREWFDMFHFKYGKKPTRIVSDFEIYSINNNKKTRIHEEKNNYFRYKTILFNNKIFADKLEIKILKVHGDSIVRIYDVSVFNEKSLNL